MFVNVVVAAGAFAVVSGYERSAVLVPFATNVHDERVAMCQLCAMRYRGVVRENHTSGLSPV